MYLKEVTIGMLVHEIANTHKIGWIKDLCTNAAGETIAIVRWSKATFGNERETAIHPNFIKPL